MRQTDARIVATFLATFLWISMIAAAPRLTVIVTDAEGQPVRRV